MMVYQFVGDVLDLDQLSDKHKISLFDESRYEDINGENSLKGQSLLPEEYQSTNIAGRKSQPKRRILSQRDEDALAGGDSLYDERLLNQDEEV